MFCKNCGNPMDNNASVCVKCGCAVGNGNQFCGNCGNPLNPYAAVCTTCGAPVAMEQKSKIAAGLLGIFLGSIGVHRFYLGYTGIGIVQIVVTIVTCGLGGIWGFIEGIMILCGAGSFKTDAKGVPLKD